MRDIFPYSKYYWYPHMKPNDIEIWERFIEKNPEEYDYVQYDFNVGDPPPFNTLMDDGEDLNQDALYRLKIDVIGHKNNYVDIIEVKPNASPSTIGQLEGYKALYLRDEPTDKKIIMTIITDKERPNMNYLCREKGIRLVVV